MQVLPCDVDQVYDWSIFDKAANIIPESIPTNPNPAQEDEDVQVIICSNPPGGGTPPAFVVGAHKRWLRSGAEAQIHFGPGDWAASAPKMTFADLDVIPNVGDVPAGWTDHRGSGGSGDSVVLPDTLKVTGGSLTLGTNA
jgi:hypothetical protein